MRRRVLAAVLGVTAGIKLALVWRFPGFLTGDDLEVVQTAARYALGVDYHAWELRCLFHPLVFVWPALKAAALCGIRDPAAVVFAAAIPNVIVSTAAIILVAALARRWGWPRETAAVAAFLYAFSWMPLAYGATPYPRPISTALLLGAFFLASSARPRDAADFAAGVLAGAAFAVRWSEGIGAAALIGWSFWKYRVWRRTLLVGAGVAAGALLFAGGFDALTWGRPFASLESFVRIMWLEIPQSRLSAEEAFPWYLRTCLHWAGPILVLLLFPAWKIRRAREPILLSLSIVLLMSLFAHKEWRYLQCAIPFLALGAAAGWERLRAGRRTAPLATAALALAVPYGVERSVTLLRDKSQSGVAASRYLRGLHPAPRVYAFEQTWAYGEHLYLGNDCGIREIELHRPVGRTALRRAAAGADVVGVYALHLDREALRELAELGFRPLRSFKKDASYECSLFGRGPFSSARPAAGEAAAASEKSPSPDGPPPPPPTGSPHPQTPPPPRPTR